MSIGDNDIRTETPECAADFYERLCSAGVDPTLISEMSDRIYTERAKAIATAARLFYLPVDKRNDPITPLEFSDELDKMKRRIWELAAAAAGVLGDRDDEGEAMGVLQLTQEVARDMEGLAAAFDAERWLKWKAQS